MSDVRDSALERAEPLWWRAHFSQLSSWLGDQLRGAEGYALSLAGEASEFIRLNRAKVRQAGEVTQGKLNLTLCEGRRQASAQLCLCGELREDRERVSAALHQLRGWLPSLPEDPHQLRAPTEGVPTAEAPAAVTTPSSRALTSHLLDAAAGLDLVGLVSSGTLWRTFQRDGGPLQWFTSARFDLDWSLFSGGDKAVKQRYAGQRFEPAVLRERVSEGEALLPLLQRPPRRIEPGDYRSFLSADALADLLSHLTYSGFSHRALQRQRSPLARLARGEGVLSPLVSLTEAPGDAGAPLFQSEGFPLPAVHPLVEAGRLVNAIVGPRSAAEEGLSVSGGEEEIPNALSLSSGALPLDGALAALNEGVWLSNLWYLNDSDQAAGRVTGMSRFASLWVEGGEPVAPLEVSRFDDTVERVLGSSLEALTVERSFLPSRSSYGARSLESVEVPGALLSALRFTG